jgi:hypothetical protein
VRKPRFIVLLAMACLLAYAIYRQVRPSGSAHGLLHPAVVQVTSRPAASSSDPTQLFPEKAPSQVAILLTQSDQGAESAARCLAAMGIPFFVTRDLRMALRHKLVLLYPEVDGATFDGAQTQAITDFVNRGGVIFAQDVFGGGFKPLFGFEDVVPLRTRHKVVFETKAPNADGVFQYLNRAEEKEVPLGSPAIPEVIWTNGYKAAAGTQILGRFEDGSAAVLRHDVGRGHTYLIGIALNDVVRRNQQNRDYEAQRIYVNRFEPGTDVWLLILRAWYETYSDSGIRLGTIPQGKRSVLMLSHDVDWEYSFKPMLAFAEFEKKSGASSTFFVQTKYLDDVNSHAFFFGESLDVLRELVKQQVDLESHTVIHSKLFNKVPLGTGLETYPSYQARATKDNAAQDATTLGEVCVSKSLLDGELEGHHTIFFRAGHLRVPPYLPEALERCGYEFDSSFTAGDVLSNFPYELDFDLGMTEPSTIFEFPVTFEDEQLPPLLERIPEMLDTIEANAENGAPSVVLIHSNNAQDKLEAERGILARLPKDILVESMTEYARFWKARSQVRWFSRPAPGGEQVEIDSELPIAGLTLVSLRRIQNATGVPGIRWTDHDVILPELAGKSRVLVQIEYSRK